MVIKVRRVEEYILRCDNCNKIIGNKNWRAFQDGCAMESGNLENLDFCSKGCAKAWCKKHITFESIKTKEIMSFKEDKENIEVEDDEF